MVPHIHIHGGRDHYRRSGRQIECGEEIVGDALREFGEDVRGSGHDQQRVDGLGDRDMLDGGVDVGRGIFAARREHFGNDFFAGERGKSQRANKLLRGPCHHHLHTDAAILQQAHHLCRLVGRNAAADSKSNFHEFALISTPIEDSD